MYDARDMYGCILLVAPLAMAGGMLVGRILWGPMRRLRSCPFCGGTNEDKSQ